MLLPKPLILALSESQRKDDGYEEFNESRESQSGSSIGRDTT